MSPRVIHIPLSGRDRRYYARELRKGEAERARLIQRLEEARIVAAEHQRMVHRLACQEWSVRQFIGGDVEPSPSIAAAIDADCIWLLVECSACGHGQRVDLTEVIWPRDKPIHTLGKVLMCARCQRDGRPKRRPNLTGLMAREPDGEPPTAAARRR